MPRTFTLGSPSAGRAPGPPCSMITPAGGLRRSSRGVRPGCGAGGAAVSGGAAPAQRLVLGDGGERECLVADLVEEDDEPVVLDPHDRARAPLPVLDRGADRKGAVLGGGLLPGGSGVVVVAVRAAVVELLAEVAEQELAPAVGGL